MPTGQLTLVSGDAEYHHGMQRAPIEPDARHPPFSPYSRHFAGDWRRI